MDGLIGLAIVFFVFRAILKSGSKKAKQFTQGARKVLDKLDTGEVFTAEGFGMFFPDAQERKPSAPASAPAPRPVTASAYTPVHAPVYTPIGESESSAYQGSYMGSMAFDSTEGIDLCAPEIGHGRQLAPADMEMDYGAEETQGTSGLSLTFTPQGLMEGIVMSEILTRPQQRRRRMH